MPSGKLETLVPTPVTTHAAQRGSTMTVLGNTPLPSPLPRHCDAPRRLPRPPLLPPTHLDRVLCQRAECAGQACLLQRAQRDGSLAPPQRRVP